MIEPFLKWPGGKRWLVQKYRHLLPVGRFSRYVEPFLGGGAVYFSLSPAKAVLRDKNVELITTYKQIKADHAALERELERLQQRHSKSFYYQVRESKPEGRLAVAARFLYLNRVCFNGIYRVNRKGEFNVPVGSKTTVSYPRDYLSRIAQKLRSATLRPGDFEEALRESRLGDFVFVDPPYTVAHNNNGFIKYNQTLFSWDDQVRLAKSVSEAVKRGAMVFVANADHGAVRELYADLPHHFTLERASILAGDRKARRRTSEAAFLSYDPGRPV